jgi:hypothetical protein
MCKEYFQSHGTKRARFFANFEMKSAGCGQPFLLSLVSEGRGKYEFL